MTEEVAYNSAKSRSMGDSSEKQVMVVGIDDSDYSTYALQWALDHLIAPASNSIFKLVLVYAKPSAASAVGFGGPGIYIYTHMHACIHNMYLYSLHCGFLIVVYFCC